MHLKLSSAKMAAIFSRGRCVKQIQSNQSLIIEVLGSNFSKIQTFSFMKIYLKLLSAKWGPFGWGLHLLKRVNIIDMWRKQLIWIGDIVKNFSIVFADDLL